MRYRVLPYKQGSRSAKALSEALEGKVLRLEGSTYWPRPDDVIINWGNTAAPYAVTIEGDHKVLNWPATIKNASNKLLFFRGMREAGVTCIPEFWETQDDIPDEAFPIVCRTVLAGHSGDGIVIASNRSELVPAPLYVKYEKKKDEYRVHVGRTLELINVDGGFGDPETPITRLKIIAVQRKARRNETPLEEVNWQVRNHQNGFVYTRQGFTTPDAVLHAARTAFLATGLDFGAVDVVYNQEKNRAFVLEINTAPGLEGQTVEDYATFFRR